MNAGILFFIEKIEKAIVEKDEKSLLKLSKKALKSPKGLIDKCLFKKEPKWLSYIWLAGANYYYDCHASMSNLLIDSNHKPFLDLAFVLRDRFKENSHHILQLLGYIKQIVPEVYIKAPISIKDSDFF